ESILVNHSGFTCPSWVNKLPNAGRCSFNQLLSTAEFTQSSIKLGKVLNNWLNMVQKPIINSNKIPKRMSFNASKMPNTDSFIAAPIEFLGFSTFGSL